MSNYFLPRMIICEDGEGCGTEGRSSSIDDDVDENYDDDEGTNESRQGDNDQKNKIRDKMNHNGNPPRTPNHTSSDPRASLATGLLADTLAELNLDLGHTRQEAGGHNTNGHDSKTAETAPLTPMKTPYGEDEKDEEDEDDTLASPGSSSKPGGFLEEKGELSPLYVGRIIGKGGEMIRDLQARSGCHIDVNQNVPEDAPRIISYRGRTHEDIDFAKQLVAKLCTSDISSSPDKHAELPLGKATLKQIQIPKAVIGRIIGRGGEMIRELQSKSHARIQVDHSGDAAMDTNHRQVTITGTHDSVLNAEQMILYLSTNPSADGHSMMRERERASWNNDAVSSVTGGHSYSRHSSALSDGPHASYCGGYSAPREHLDGGLFYLPFIETDTIPCSRQDVGHIIGRKGVTIRDLQQRTSCNIQIDQQNFQISITGPRQGIEMAKSMLHDIMEKGPHHMYALGFAPLEEEHQHHDDDESYLGLSSLGFASVGQQQQHQHYQGPPHRYDHDPYALPIQHQMQQQCYGDNSVYSHQQVQPHLPLQQPQPHFPPMQQPVGIQHQFPPQAIVSHWRIASAVDGQIYYYNTETGETQWEKPVGM